MRTPTMLGASKDLAARPLIHGLAPGDPFMISSGVPSMNAVRLRQGDLAAALVSPIDYAREASLYRIVPGIAVSSIASSGMAAIHFREGVRSLATLAVDPASTMEVILAKIILAESFDVAPKIVPISAPLDEMLSKADAALLVGDQALREDLSSTRSLNLIEEWMELTELPFVHALWCGKEHALDAAQILMLQETRDRGVSRLGEICALPEVGASFSAIAPDELEQYLEGFSYDFSEDISSALKEIFTMAYFHGILPDVPELRFYGDDSGSEDDPGEESA